MKMPFRYRTAFLLSRIGNLTILAGMTLLLGGCHAGGSIWKETISLEPKDKTVSEETLDPETDIGGQVARNWGWKCRGRANPANLRQNREKMIQMSVHFCLPEISIFPTMF